MTVIKYLWEESHNGHFSPIGPFTQCPESEVVAASDYDRLWDALLECRIHLATPAADESDVAMIDKIDAALRGPDVAK